VSPRTISLAIDTELWRVHPQAKPATVFNEGLADDVFGGHRFDGTLTDPYPYLYAARDCATALLERFGRDVPFNHQGIRLVPRSAVARQCISAMRVAAPLTLISLLSSQDLAAVCQDEWLIQSDPAEYPQTRRWGSWLRTQAPDADGIIWPSRRNLNHRAIVLFGDRCPHPVRDIDDSTINLDSLRGGIYLNTKLRRHHIQVKLPARRLGANDAI
jgi:RES domain-containing protein